MASVERRCVGFPPGPQGRAWKIGEIALLLREGRPQEAGAGRWGGHSCRRGGAQFYHRMGIHLSVIKYMGRWGSNAVLRYIEEVEVVPEELAPRVVRRLAGLGARSSGSTQREEVARPSVFGGSRRYRNRHHRAPRRGES